MINVFPASTESFSRQVKSELTRNWPERSCCRQAELSAFVHFRGYIIISNKKPTLDVVVEGSPVARHFFSLVKEIGGTPPQVIHYRGSRMETSYFILRVQEASRIENLLPSINIKEESSREPGLFTSENFNLSRCCRRSYLRGAFIAAGYLSSPRSGYHLEIFSEYEEYARVIKMIMYKFNIEAAVRKRKNGYYTYVKNADSITEFLRVIKAHHSLLQVENQRVFKSMRNQVNRVVNCETANLDKSLQASRYQLQVIDKIERLMGLENLPGSLREVARLRRNYPEASLKELGEMMHPPLGKSGMNHRFRKMEQISRKL